MRRLDGRRGLAAGALRVTMRRMYIVSIALAAMMTAGLGFTVPQGWRQSPGSSSMRVAEFALPRAAGDAEDAQLIVYYFGGSGGSVDANIQRWTAQMQQPDGKPIADAKRTSRTVNGLSVTLVDVAGTYVAETAPGGGERHNKPRYRLRAGVVQTPNGPYFIKLTGPEKTVTIWNSAYEQFVSSFKAK
jgi:hypothetical protein